MIDRDVDGELADLRRGIEAAIDGMREEQVRHAGNITIQGAIETCIRLLRAECGWFPREATWGGPKLAIRSDLPPKADGPIEMYETEMAMRQRASGHYLCLHCEQMVDGRHDCSPERLLPDRRLPVCRDDDLEP